jgi:hypothetical protein
VKRKALLLTLLGLAAGCFEPLVGPTLVVLAPDGGADAPADVASPADAPVDAPMPDARPDATDARDAADATRLDIAPDRMPDRAPDLAPDLAPDRQPDTLACPGAEMACNGRCVAVQTDPDNCGGCDQPCSSGICSASACQSPGAGRLILIGHDYAAATAAGPSNLLGNAVLLAARAPTQILTFEGNATVAAVQNANAAIAQVAGTRGRTYTMKSVTSGQVVSELSSHDVFLIYAQTGATDAALDQLGTAWASAMVAFVSGGKTIVLLDGASATNTGTIRVLIASGMFAGSTRAVTTGTLSVVSAADPVARNVPASYTAPITSVTFGTTELVKVVQSSTGAPVVVHRVY